MKKLRLFILTIIMLFTVLPVNIFAGGEDKTSEPDVSVYATKQQLMDDTFRPDANGTASNTGKIVFGKNSSGDPQEWYVLGADSGVNDGKNNTIIFATSPIATNQIFNLSNETYSYEEGTGYGDISGSIEVELCHYGASDLRKMMQEMLIKDGNVVETYFTSAEQGMMNLTTMTTKDTKNMDSSSNYLTYTTTDKLYALAADDERQIVIKAGSNNQISIARDVYWNNGYIFWLRTPIVGDHALSATPKGSTYINIFPVEQKYDIRPASNLNLTSILFASAAKADSTGTIADGAAMTLRLDGTDEDVVDLYGSIGEVYYDNATNEIVANKGNTGNEVYLVVQGKDPKMTEDQNWYYSKKITGEETIKASEIKSALGLVSNVSLADSKIWLEINDNVDRKAYAVEAKAVEEINRVELSVPVPVAGNPISPSVTCDTDGVGIYLASWDTLKPEAGYYKQYTVTITLKCELGYKFAGDVTGEINGNNVTVSNDTEGKKKVSYTFPYTKDKLISVSDPTITFDNGTSLEVIKNSLPLTVNVTTAGRKEIKLPVTWNLNAQPFKDYDPNDKGKQEFDVTGAVTLDDTFENYGGEDVPGTTLHVIVDAVVPVTPVPPSSTGSTTNVGYVVPNTAVK